MPKVLVTTQIVQPLHLSGAHSGTDERFPRRLDVLVTLSQLCSALPPTRLQAAAK